MEDCRTPKRLQKTCCCQLDDCHFNTLRGNNDIWGVRNAVVICVASTVPDKVLALRDNIVHHLRCPESLKQYTIARHHSKTVITAIAGGKRWSTLLTAAEARGHNICEMCDSFVDSNGCRMYVRAPITPYSIARTTGHSHTPRTSQFAQRQRLQEQGATRSYEGGTVTFHRGG